MKYLMFLLFFGCASSPPSLPSQSQHGWQVLHCVSKQGRIDLELKIIDLEEGLVACQKTDAK